MGNPYFPSHDTDSMGGAVPYAHLARLLNLGPQQGQITAQQGAAAAAAGLSKEGLQNASALSAAAKVELARGDDLMYGIDSGAANIAAGATATLTVTPQKRHVPQRIFMTAAVANNFVVNDIRSGVEPILATVGAISAAVFIQDATIPPFRSVIMEVGMDFSMTVTNVTGAPQRFTCTVLGKYLPWSLEVSAALKALVGPIG